MLGSVETEHLVGHTLPSLEAPSPRSRTLFGRVWTIFIGLSCNVRCCYSGASTEALRFQTLVAQPSPSGYIPADGRSINSATHARSSYAVYADEGRIDTRTAVARTHTTRRVLCVRHTAMRAPNRGPFT